MGGNNNNKSRRRKNKRQRPIPLVASSSISSSSVSSSAAGTASSSSSSLSSIQMKSRKKARQITTLFHKLTKQREIAILNDDTALVQKLDYEIESMGGRPEYQRASVLSTSYHSTSKWVLGQLALKGWLYGIREQEQSQQKVIEETTNEKREESGVEDEDGNIKNITNNNNNNNKKKPRLRDLSRRTTRILEVGAINTELLDAAQANAPVAGATTATTTSSSSLDDELKGNDEKKTTMSSDDSNTLQTNDNNNHNSSNNKKRHSSGGHHNNNRHNIHVRAIDIHSMVKGRIEEYDFLELPYLHEDDITQRYDCIVCSMVINCVPTPTQRGEMLTKLYHHLRPGGLCFLTLPKFCLIKSAFLSPTLFEELLSKTGVGFQIISTKSSPRVSFYVLRRPAPILASSSLQQQQQQRNTFDPKWTKLIVRNKGPKYPNQFSVVLNKTLVLTGKREDE